MKTKTPKFKLYARQGDVYIFQIEEIPSKVQLVPKKSSIVALGEITGHHHEVLVVSNEEAEKELLIGEDPNDKGSYFVDTTGALIQHHTHETIPLPKGKYYTRIQREYDAVQYQRRVMD